MTPTDYAAHELALWQEALSDQQQAERELQAAYAAREHERAFELVKQVRVLRTSADLLLARAVKVKCDFRDHTVLQFGASTTQSGELAPGSGA